MEVMESKELDIYTPYVKRVLKKIGMSVGYTASPAIVAGKIYRVADCSTGRLRYPVGGGAGIMLFFRRILPTRWFNRMVSGILE